MAASLVRRHRDLELRRDVRGVDKGVTEAEGRVEAFGVADVTQRKCVE